MATQQTLSILKPDSVSKNQIGKVIDRFESQGLHVVAARMEHLSKEKAENFYAIHRGRPFFNDLVHFMTSGPVLVMVLEGPDAVTKNRDIMGATNPKEASPGTIRADFAQSIDENMVHGSDSAENAKTEIAFFFKDHEICKRTR